MPLGPMDNSVFFLITHFRAQYPVILKYFVHGGTLCGIDLEHSSNDVAAFSW